MPCIIIKKTLIHQLLYTEQPPPPKTKQHLRSGVLFKGVSTYLSYTFLIDTCQSHSFGSVQCVLVAATRSRSQSSSGVKVVIYSPLHNGHRGIQIARKATRTVPICLPILGSEMIEPVITTPTQKKKTNKLIYTGHKSVEECIFCASFAYNRLCLLMFMHFYNKTSTL